MDALLIFIKRTLPDEVSAGLYDRLVDLEQGRFDTLFAFPLVKVLLGHEQIEKTQRIELSNFKGDWNDYIFDRLDILLSKREAGLHDGAETPLYLQYLFFLVAIAALQAFIQSNITGPPLPFNTAEILFPREVRQDDLKLSAIRSGLLKSLTVDGESVYRLTPNIELLCLADAILTCPPIKKNIRGVEWASMRITFMHQRILSEMSPTLQEMIYHGLDAVESLLDSDSDDLRPRYLLEKAAINTHHGFDKIARDALSDAARARGFEFALTGRLGKRTKYQEHDISQLVVLARSKEEPGLDGNHLEQNQDAASSADAKQASKPQNLDLNDDTLLESISFSKTVEPSVDIVESDALPSSLASIDPEHQPLLQPLDSINLLALASSITNTSPADGLTREETLPYALRVLDGGSSNWQIYTQALLVRSRIEGYRSRTTERGLLQLQALVDEVIAETTGGAGTAANSSGDAPSTFLPRASESESAPVGERLIYVHELCPPTRWELEAELAARWVSLGGLRTALEIYSRLEMWAEEALCWAAVDREDKARKIIRRQLFHSTGGDDAAANLDEEQWQGGPRDPPPTDAPRFYCILGDIEQDISMYEKAWEVSACRYARAQRSLGRHYFSRNKHVEAAAAYSKALNINQLNHASWFALGCALLELDEFERAAEAFGRTVQLEDGDAEAWSNLAAALLKKGNAVSGSYTASSSVLGSEDREDEAQPRSNGQPDSQQHIRDALRALKRAASLKYDNHRIWDNLLTVAATLKPPSYSDMITALQRIIELRGKVEGEKCIDVAVLELLVRHVVSTSEFIDTKGGEGGAETKQQRGVPRLVIALFDDHVLPLITSSARLWRLVSTLSLWRKRPGEALAANEKSWRIVTGSSSGWESGTKEQWDEVVEATIDLCDAYESLGPLASESGQGDEVVAKDWRFKARSAMRGVMGKAQDSWEGSEGWKSLEGRLTELKASRTSD